MFSQLLGREQVNQSGPESSGEGHLFERSGINMIPSKKTAAHNDVRNVVREKYGGIAKQNGSCCGTTSCCGGPSANSVASTVGYSKEELAGLPDGANMGLSCGNPTAFASLHPGDVVLDLGSGGGFDVFIAARKIGPSGRAIGVDMTQDMLEKARRNAVSFRKQASLDNVEFRLGEIEHLPVADASVNVVISNCVINLSPDKPQVWREIARVLAPGGRVSVSDLALLKPLPDGIRESLEALVGCIAGAVLVDETREMVRAAGLVKAVFETKSDYINQMTAWNVPLFREIAGKLPPGKKPGDFVASLNITARKPK
jgi:SAM-dependent methyltransferase